MTDLSSLHVLARGCPSPPDKALAVVHAQICSTTYHPIFVAQVFLFVLHSTYFLFITFGDARALCNFTRLSIIVPISFLSFLSLCAHRRLKLPSQRAYPIAALIADIFALESLTFRPFRLTPATIAHYKWRRDCEGRAWNIGLRNRSLSYGLSLVRRMNYVRMNLTD